MTKHFHKALDSIKKRLLTLGAMVEERVHLSAQAVLDKDIDLAARFVKVIMKWMKWKWKWKRSA